MIKKYKYLFILTSLFIFWNCDDDFDNDVTSETITSGRADFSNYVAVGNSLTAGFYNGTLFTTGQENSFPNILATQMSEAGGGTFNLPLMQDDIGGFSDVPGFPGQLFLVDLAPTLDNMEAQSSLVDNATSLAGGTYNNLGVPGAKSFHLTLAGYAALNPYYGRFASSPTTTLLEAALAQNPTFFSLWIGNNDVLGYATSGGVSNNDDCVPSETEPCINALTNTTVFEQLLTAQVQALTANGAKGVIANIPSVTSIPFFTAVTYDALDADTNEAFAAQIPTLNATYGALNQVFAILGATDRTITFNTSGTSAIVVHDESLTDLSAQITQVLGMSSDPTIQALAPIYGAQFGQARQATENDLVTLTASSEIGQVNTARAAQLAGLGVPAQQAGLLAINGLTYPMEDQYVLIPAEQNQISSKVSSYNATIESVANQFDLALVDANSELQTLSNSGLSFNGVSYTSAFITGNAFSLDGVHPTPKGYAIIANLFIDAINNKYGSNLRSVNPNGFPGVVLP